LLSTLGYAVAAVAADFGGSLVYNQRIGVDHNAAQSFPGDFTSVMSEAELREEHLTRAEFNGSRILLLRRGQRIFAIAETCSHLGGPLSEGKLDGVTVECPWHGSRFSLETGEVIDGPAVHRQPCLDARVNNGRIEIRKRSPQVLQTAEQQEVPAQRTGTLG
jgi:nitrite reductase/ring-hydroxylating ferredoxin subunit